MFSHLITRVLYHIVIYNKNFNSVDVGLSVLVLAMNTSVFIGFSLLLQSIQIVFAKQ